MHEEPVETEEITGVVLGFESNDMGDIDKMELYIKNDTVLLRFPPNAAQKILAIAKVKKLVTAVVRTDEGADKKRQEAFPIITLLTDTPKAALDLRHIPPPPPQQGEPTEIAGTNIEIKTDMAGHATGFVLANKLIALPPHIAANLLPLLNKTAKIIVKGYKRNPADGFVNIQGLELVKPFSITIDKTNYLMH